VIWIGPVPYDAEAKTYLARSDHYLGNPPTGALFAVGVRRATPGLFEGEEVGSGPLLGLCVVGRPVARMLAQDGTIGEVTRLHLAPGLPHGTASRVLRRAAEVAAARGMDALIAYHDRTRHTGCVYRKAGFRRDGTTRRGSRSGSWGTRERHESAVAASAAPKRRWRLEISRGAVAGDRAGVCVRPVDAGEVAV
jgi:hypothetical protein